MPRRAKAKRLGGSEEARRVVDKDSTCGGDFDLCERCGCARHLHEDGAGECPCGDCNKFREP